MENEVQEYKYMVATRCFTYNHAPYIEDALRGFAMQETTFPVVTIIVDDASTDGEQEVIRSYLSEHFQSPYRTEETEYANIICARHKTNANCDFVVLLLRYNHYSIKKPKMPYLSEWLDNAKYHALCEGDDYWNHPKKLQMQVDFLENHPNYVLCYTDSRIVDEHNNRLFHNTPHRYSGDVLKQLILKGNFIVTAGTLFRNLSREWEEERLKIPFAMKMGDKPMWIFLSSKGKFQYMPDVMVSYRVLRESASHSADFNKILTFKDNGEQIALYFNKRYEVGISERVIKKDYAKGKTRAAAKYSKSLFTDFFKRMVKEYPGTLFSPKLLAIAFIRIILNKAI